MNCIIDSQRRGEMHYTPCFSRNNRTARRTNKAFTLLEISIVLVIIGFITAGGLAVLTVSVKSQQVNSTVSHMEEIQDALLNYGVIFTRLPCPSDITLQESDTNYGAEAATPGTCTGGTPAANFVAASGTVEGGVPTRALKLPDSYMYDSWGRRIRYAVDPSKTIAGAIPTGTGNCVGKQAITIKDATGASRSVNAAYALVSHGANGHGGYTKNAVVYNAGNTNTDKQNNCHCDNNAAGTTYTPTYVQKLPTQDSSNSLNIFDDIVAYKEGWQLQTATTTLGLSSCVQYLYVVDSYNNRVEKFATDGTFISQFGSFGSGNGQFNFLGNYPNGGSIAVDSQGNVYVGDFGNMRIQKFDSSGQYILQFGSAGSGNGQFANNWYPLASMAIDSQDNLWVTDSGNSRAEKFSTNGTFLLQLPCPSGSCPGNTMSTLNGYTRWMTIDKNDNVYFQTGDGTHTIIRYDSTGNYINYVIPTYYAIGSLGVDNENNLYAFIYGSVNKYSITGTTYTLLFSYDYQDYGGGASGRVGDQPGNIVVDKKDNIYIADPRNNRIEVFDTNWNYIRQIGNCTSGPCAASTDPGAFNTPSRIAISH